MCVTGTDLVTHFLCHGTGSTGILLIARVSAALQAPMQGLLLSYFSSRLCQWRLY